MSKATVAVVVGGSPSAPPPRLVPMIDAPTRAVWGRCRAPAAAQAYLRIQPPHAAVQLWVPVLWGRRASDPPGWCIDPTGRVWDTAHLPLGVTVWATVVAAAQED